MRTQILRWFRSVGFVEIIDFVAERLTRFVEHDCHMRWPIRLMQVIGQFPQHGGIAVDSPDWLAANIGQRRQAVVGTENIGRAVDEIEMLLFRHTAFDSSGFRPRLS